MKVTAVKSFNSRESADVLVLPFWQGKNKAEPAGDFKELAPYFSPPIELGDFLGKEGDIQVVYGTQGKGKSKESRFLLIGLGEKKKKSEEVLRRACAVVVKMASRKKWTELNIFVPEGSDGEAIAEGVLLANYHYLKLKGHTLKENPYIFLNHVCFIGIQAELLTKVEKVIKGVNLARDLVNGNADDINADALVKVAKELGNQFPKLHVRTLRKKELTAEKLGLILAVNRGAATEPALIICEYKGDPKSKETTALIGKGVTFDTGGLNIKPTGSMETMKNDMAGAAAVLGVLLGAAELGLKKNLIGVIATVENAVGPLSFKPGDVYKSYSGKTVEITNTDAEGRLILADALSYVQDHYEPTRMIDLATLTGGIVVALGEEMTGLFSNNDSLAQSLVAAGLKTYERLWRMPIVPEYKEKLKSSIADIKNAGPRSASAPTAAFFLEQFVKDVPWAHLDIAGSAYLPEPKYYHQTHATGIGVRLLLEWLQT